MVEIDDSVEDLWSSEASTSEDSPAKALGPLPDERVGSEDGSGTSPPRPPKPPRRKLRPSASLPPCAVETRLADLSVASSPASPQPSSPDEAEEPSLLDMTKRERSNLRRRKNRPKTQPEFYASGTWRLRRVSWEECRLCSAKVPVQSVGNRMKHAWSRHVAEETYACPTCPYKVRTWYCDVGRWRRHFARRRHKGEALSRPKDLRTADMRQRLADSVRQCFPFAAEEPLQSARVEAAETSECRLCGEAVKAKTFNLKCHAFRHAQPRAAAATCRHCDYAIFCWTAEDSAYRHLALHHAELGRVHWTECFRDERRSAKHFLAVLVQQCFP